MLPDSGTKLQLGSECLSLSCQKFSDSLVNHSSYSNALELPMSFAGPCHTSRRDNLESRKATRKLLGVHGLLEDPYGPEEAQQEIKLMYTLTMDIVTVLRTKRC